MPLRAYIDSLYTQISNSDENISKFLLKKSKIFFTEKVVTSLHLFFASLFFSGQLGGPKNLEKLILDRYIKWQLEIILSEFLEPSMWPGKNNLTKNCPMHCLSSWA